VWAAFVTHESVADLVDLVDLVRESPQFVPDLSPLSVVPSRQREGIGGSLVQAGLRAADLLGQPLVILEGSPRY
jgi:putative acetyltransferase